MPRPVALVGAALVPLLVASAARAVQDRPRRIATPSAITHVAIIDVTTGATQPDQTVIISGRRIEAVGPSTTLRPPRGARVLEGGERS